MNKDGKSRDNCYLILELPYDAPDLSEVDIAKAINTKHKFWSKTSHIKYGAIYEDYNKNIKYIQEIMLNPELRKKEAELAKRYVDEVLPKRMSMYHGLSRISRTEVASIEDDTGIPRSFLEKMIPKTYNIEIAAIAEGSMPDPNPKPDTADVYNRSVQQLSELGCEDLYDFLKLPEESVNVRKLENDELTARIMDIEQSLRKASRTTWLTYKQNLCKLARKAFADPPSREDYEAFLVWQKTDEVIKSIKSNAAVNDNQIIGTAADNYLKELTRIHNGDVKKAEQKLRDIGLYYKIFIIKQIDVNTVKTCPNCARILEKGKKIRICPHCGATLIITCPKCKTENESGAKFCVNCRSSFSDLEKALRKCQEARDCIRRGDLDQAKNLLAVVGASWRELEELRTAKEELNKTEDILRLPVEEIRKLIKDRNYYTARKKLEDFKKLFPESRIPEEDSIKAALLEAEKLFTRIDAAEKARDTQTVIRYCEEVMELCRDYPGVREKMLKNPPAPVSRVTVRTNPSDHSNVVSWDASSTQGNITYVVRRKVSSPAQSVTDGEDMGEYGTLSFVDRNVQGGVEYFYTVFTRRAGIDSRGCSHSSPAVNYTELTLRSVDSGDGYVQITWEALPSGAVVRAFRKAGEPPRSPEEGREVRTGASRLLDEGLKNDVTYGYLLCCAYNRGGQQILTRGIMTGATPVALPEPPDNLVVTHLQDDLFEASWESEGTDKTLLFFSDEEIPYEYGESISENVLSEKLKKVRVVSRTSEGCRFRMEGEGFFHVMAAAVKYDMAVCGDKTIASNVKSMEVKEIRIVGKDIYIQTDWPKNARAVVALYRHDAYPVGITDRSAQRVYIKKSVYERNNALVIKDAKDMSYYFSLFGEILLNDQVGYTQAATAYLENSPKVQLRYSIKVNGLFGGKQAEISFKSSTAEFVLPSIDIYQAAGVQPLYKSKGVILLHIEQQKVENGVFSVKIPLKGMSKGIGIRPFFTDDALYESSSLRPEAGTEHMIT